MRAARQYAKQAILSPQHTAAVLKLARWLDERGWRDQPVSEQEALLFACIGDVAPAPIERRWRQSCAASDSTS
jgi:hypothetical protein